MRNFVLVLAVVLAACGPAETPSAPPPATSSSAPAPAPTPVKADETRPEITIGAPRGPITSNPFEVAGYARTFENNVVIRLRDSKGALMTERFTTSDGEMGKHNPYSRELFVTRDPGSSVTVETLEYSAKDGSERSLAKVTVPFDVPPIETTLYVAGEDCDVKPAKRMVPKSRALARLTVEALMAAQPKLFPKGAEVRSMNLRGGVLTIDFNETMQNVGGACRARALRGSIEKTLGGIAGMREVVITAAGSRELALQP